MILTRISVNRPIATLMFYLGLCLLGVISWMKLPQDLFPPVSYPQVTVVTSYPNAAPEEVQNLISKPIEETISTVANLKRIQSVSREGLSLVTAEFGWATKMDFAALAIRQKIDLVKERLPRECKDSLAAICPVNFGQASRMIGVRAADIAVLHIYVEKWKRVQRESA